MPLPVGTASQEITPTLPSLPHMLRMQEEAFKQREESLKRRDVELQDSLIRFSKFLQDNNAKRLRADKRAADERRLCEEKKKEIEQVVGLRVSLQLMAAYSCAVCPHLHATSNGSSFPVRRGMRHACMRACRACGAGNHSMTAAAVRSCAAWRRSKSSARGSLLPCSSTPSATPAHHKFPDLSGGPRVCMQDRAGGAPSQQ